MADFEDNQELQEESFGDDGLPKNDEADKTMSLLGGVAGIDEEGVFDEFGNSSESAGSRLLSHGTLIIAIIIVIGAGTLYAMRVSQKQLTSKLDPEVAAKIEGFLIKAGNPLGMSMDDPLRKENINSLLDDTDDILDTFKADPTQQQVPIEYVKKNPFMIRLFKENIKPENDIARPEDQDKALRARRELLKRLQAEVDSMRIQSVMWGKNPVAIIDNELYQASQTVGSFTITKVNRMSVELAAHGEMFVLEMERAKQ